MIKEMNKEKNINFYISIYLDFRSFIAKKESPFCIISNGIIDEHFLLNSEINIKVLNDCWYFDLKEFQWH